jgi:hypothetical protein
LLTGVDEARKLTIWMKANIGPGAAICVKYVLDARESSNGSLVWKSRRGRRGRPGSAALRSLRSTLLHFSIPLFLFSFLFTGLLRQNHPRSSLSLLFCFSALGRHPAPSTRRCCAAQRVRLQGLSPRPVPAGVVAFWNVGRQGQREAVSGHGIRRRTGGRAGGHRPAVGGKGGGHRRADCPCAKARPPAPH